MYKKYILSIDKGLDTSEQENLKRQFSSLNVHVSSNMPKLGVMVVEVPNERVVIELRKLKGIVAVEDDSAMNIQ